MDSSSSPRLTHRQVQVESQSIHVVEGGAAGNGSMLFLHGWPESWFAFEQVMLPLSEHAQVVAIDLPGIGQSQGEPDGYDARSLAHLVHRTIETLGLTDVTLVGHDFGGMITYAYLHAYPHGLRSAAILNTAVPGVDPWDDVSTDADIWHFAFHRVPGLPEILVQEHVAEYFSFFYEALAGPVGVGARARRAYAEAYASPVALHTGFEWYRALPQNAEDNAGMREHEVQTPVLYVRGDRERGDITSYMEGFQASGLQNVSQAIIANSGHFAPDEQPHAVADALLTFVRGTQVSQIGSQLEPTITQMA